MAATDESRTTYLSLRVGSVRRFRKKGDLDCHCGNFNTVFDVVVMVGCCDWEKRRGSQMVEITR